MELYENSPCHRVHEHIIKSQPQEDLFWALFMMDKGQDVWNLSQDFLANLKSGLSYHFEEHRVHVEFGDETWAIGADQDQQFPILDSFEFWQLRFLKVGHQKMSQGRYLFHTQLNFFQANFS